MSNETDPTSDSASIMNEAADEFLPGGAHGVSGRSKASDSKLLELRYCILASLEVGPSGIEDLRTVAKRLCGCDDELFNNEVELLLQRGHIELHRGALRRSAPRAGG
jgi:hypothetical protein